MFSNLSFYSSLLSHYLEAKTKHGIHSPFVYHLLEEVIYDKATWPDYISVESLRCELLNDPRTITVSDLGAGSQVNKNRKKQVSEIAKNALKPPKLAQLLYRLVRHLKPKTSIELGTCLGVTTAYLAKAAPQSRLITIEGCQETAAIAAETLEKAGITNAELHTGNFDEVLPGILSGITKLDFVFIDGNHRKEATLNYFKLFLPKLHENSLILFDDIYWSKGMKEAWEEIKAHPEVTLTVDLFWIGLVFFKPGQAKEHFRIRV